MMKIKQFIGVILALLLSVSVYGQDSRTPAFPGAEGGGMYTTGGRGGAVYYVNTLEDTNTGNTTTREGSLRWCVGRSGPRTIVFKVSGIIALKSKLNIANGDLTIAGQTAPGDGICIKDYSVTLGADNVIIRYIRFRMGDEKQVEDDAFWGRYKKNIIIDHCSMSWSTDECSSFYDNENFTMQWCILSESLNNSLHAKGAHGYGGIWGGKNATFHHNLLAHHNSRNPRFNGWKRSGLNNTAVIDEERVDYRNNVIYNWGDNSAYGGESDGHYNMVGNYYKAGAATKSSIKNRIVQISNEKTPIAGVQTFGTFYIADNYVHGYPAVTTNNWSGVAYDSGVDKTKCVAGQPFDFSKNPVSMHTAEKAFEKVLAYGGASYARDAVDTRVTNEAKTGTTTYTGSITKRAGLIDSQSEVGGWPEYKSTAAPADVDRDGIPDGWLEKNYPGKNATDKNEEGYTYLEIYLNSLVADITQKQLADNISTGIPSLLKRMDTVSVYYDPSAKQLKVSADQEIKKITVLSLQARKMHEFAVSKGNTVVQKSLSLPSGIYIVAASLEKGEVATNKIIVL